MLEDSVLHQLSGLSRDRIECRIRHRLSIIRSSMPIDRIAPKKANRHMLELAAHAASGFEIQFREKSRTTPLTEERKSSNRAASKLRMHPEKVFDVKHAACRHTVRTIGMASAQSCRFCDL